jgi:hypothetical protein
MDYENQKASLKTAKALRDPHLAEVHRAYWLTFPQGSPNVKPGTVQTRRHLFSSTAPTAIRNWASNVRTVMFPEDDQWCQFALKAGIANTSLNLDVQKTNSILYSEINKSGFSLAMDESLMDCGIAGFGSFGIRYDKDCLHVEAFPMKSIYFLDSGTHRGIDKIFREHRLPARSIANMYKAVPDWIITKANGSKSDDLVDIIEFMQPGQKDGEWELHTVTHKWEPLLKQVLKFKPFHVYRMLKLPGESFPDSIVRQALADINTSNAVSADLLDMTAYQARPARLATGDPSLAKPIRAGQTLYGLADAAIKVIDGGSNSTMAMQVLDRVDQKINDALMAQSLPNVPGQRMTTAEVQARRADFLTSHTVYADRLERECVIPAMTAIIDCLKAAGRITLDRTVKDSPYEIVTNSINAKIKAQKEIDRIMGLWTYAVEISAKPVPGMSPAKVLLYVLREGGFPEELIPTEEEAQTMHDASSIASGIGGAIQTVGGQGGSDAGEAIGQMVGTMARNQNQNGQAPAFDLGALLGANQ